MLPPEEPIKLVGGPGRPWEDGYVPGVLDALRSNFLDGHIDTRIWNFIKSMVEREVDDIQGDHETSVFRRNNGRAEEMVLRCENCNGVVFNFRKSQVTVRDIMLANIAHQVTEEVMGGQTNSSRP
jgi:hypothetical protein